MRDRIGIDIADLSVHATVKGTIVRNGTGKALEIITQWLLQRKPELTHIPPDLDLIENRVLDSLSLMEFLFVLEQETGTSQDPESLEVDDFRTLRSIEKRFLASR
jgi:acyl carrier protein